MNKKILISLSVIGVVSAIVIGGTMAYFSDTETSTGNTFTAGGIDLEIDNECYLNGQLVTDCTWELKDLDENDLFFNFTDLKPGDWGEDTVSLHVDNNPAWACVTFKNLVSSDNDCTEPELEDESGCGVDGEGELAKNLQFFFWADVCEGSGMFPDAYAGDNIFQPVCDYELVGGKAEDILPSQTYVLAAPGYPNVFTRVFDEPLTGSESYYIGKAWCFGELGAPPVGPNGLVWTCDGEQVDNASQTDSLSGDIEFYAVQSKNNEEFTCSGIDE